MAADPPSTRTFLSNLISQLSAVAPPDPPPATGGDLLASLPPSSQKLLLTLHCLLPYVLLPALDLLDKGLVTRYILAQGEPAQTSRQPCQGVYYVRSATFKGGSKFSTPPSSLYEVRTLAWNCTCASFAFAACSSAHHSFGMEDHAGVKLWGAHCLGEGEPPVCKHLVACVLAEQCRLFAGFVIEETVDINRMAELAVVWD